MNRDDLEKQFNLQYKDKTSEEMLQIGADIAHASIEKDKQDVKNKMQALRAMFHACNPVPSDRFKT